MFEGLLQPSHLLIIIAVALVIFGPKNLPKLGKSLGATIKSVRDGMEGFGEDEPKSTQAEVTAAPAAPVATAPVPAAAPAPVVAPVATAPVEPASAAPAPVEPQTPAEPQS